MAPVPTSGMVACMRCQTMSLPERVPAVRADSWIGGFAMKPSAGLKIPTDDEVRAAVSKVI